MEQRLNHLHDPDNRADLSNAPPANARQFRRFIRFPIISRAADSGPGLALLAAIAERRTTPMTIREAQDEDAGSSLADAVFARLKSDILLGVLGAGSRLR